MNSNQTTSDAAWDRIKDKYPSKPTSSKSPTELDHSFTSKTSFEEAKKLIQNFREKISKYPKHLSYEGSVVLCVMLSMEEIAYISLNKLPLVDQTLIRTMVPDQFLDGVFSVTFDNIKDFDMKFSCHSENDPYLITLLNAVAHPRPEDINSGEVPIENDGDKIAVGGRILLNKKGIKRLIGMDPLKRDSTKNNQEEESYPRRQPVAGRNAFEIRSDLIQISTDLLLHNNRNGEVSPEEVVASAKVLYTFVENKR